MVELLMRKREMGMKMRTMYDDMSRWEKSGVLPTWLGVGFPISVCLPDGSGVVPAVSGLAN